MLKNAKAGVVSRFVISARGCVGLLGSVGSRGHGVAEGERVIACRGGGAAELSCCGGSLLLLKSFNYHANRTKDADLA